MGKKGTIFIPLYHFCPLTNIQSLSQCGSFGVEIPSTSTKKKYTGVMYRLPPMYQEKEEILQHILSLKQYKVMMPQFTEEECFFIIFSGVLKKSYCFPLIRVFMQV